MASKGEHYEYRGIAPVKKVLHVGCGQATKVNMPAGFQSHDWEEVRFDIDETVKPDLVGTLLQMDAVDDASVDAIYSSHNIEHVYFHEVPQVLSEFKRVLKDDGFAIVRCPDIQEVAKHIAKGVLDGPLYHSPSGPITPLDVLYGHGASIRKGGIYMAHKTGFSLQLLGKRLTEAGFGRTVGVEVKHNYELIFLASKRERPDHQLLEMFSKYTGQSI